MDGSRQINVCTASPGILAFRILLLVGDTKAGRWPSVTRLTHPLWPLLAVSRTVDLWTHLESEHGCIEVCFTQVRRQEGSQDAQAASGGQESRCNTQKANGGPGSLHDPQDEGRHQREEPRQRQH